MTKITLTAETFTITLDKLYRDDANTRLTDREADVPNLAENIAREGLLQNLGVRAQLDDAGQPTGRYGVVIGGRRLAALQLLATAKRLAKSAPIPCALVADKAVTSAGLAENWHRIAMHPADAYLAFAKLADEGMREKHIAVRFGISPLTVQRRMRLGRLSPVLLDALRANTITDAVAQAYAITTDHQAQERVYGQMAGRSWIAPQSIRDVLTEGDVPAHDRRVGFVGVAAYEKAGGTVRRDLFSDDSDGFTLTDAGLLDKLVLRKLDEEANKLRAEGWHEVHASLHKPDGLYNYATAEPIETPLSEADTATLDALQQELEALEEQSADDGLTDAESERADVIEAQIAALHDRQQGYDDATKAIGQAYVYLSYQGLDVFYAVPRVTSAGEADDEDEAQGQDAEMADGTTPAPSPTPEEPAGLTYALQADLCAQRSAALQAQVAQRPDLALRLLVQGLILAKAHKAWDGPVKLIMRETPLRYGCPGIADTKAARLLATLHDEQARATPAADHGLLPWLLAMTDAEVLAILAPLVATGIDGGNADWTAMPDCLAAQAAAAADLDMRDYWQATAESYFARVSKAQIGLDMHEGEGGPVSLNDAKAAIAATAARQIGAKGWLPTMLRPAPASADTVQPGAATPALPNEGAANDDAEPIVQAAE